MSRIAALWDAVLEGDCQRIDALLAGRDVNIITEEDKWNLLHMAADDEVPNPAVIRHLIELGVDVNAKDRRGWTPLHFAARTNRGPRADPSLQTASVKTLIDAGADVNTEDDEGVTPLHRSAFQYPWNVKMIETLLAAGAKKTDIFCRFMNAVAGPDKDKVVDLLAKYHTK